MRKIYYLLIFIFSFSVLSAQEKLSKEEKARREKNIQAGNPFAKYGYKAKVATLSKGKYLEFHDLDSIVTIGTSRWHVDNKKIVGDIVIDSLNVDAQPIGDAPGMWMSPDPLSEEYPSYSPYTYVANNPTNLIDPDGREIVDPKGNRVTYSVNRDGSLKWSKNATADIKRIGNALNLTETGRSQLSKVDKSDILVKMNISPKDFVETTKDGKISRTYGDTKQGNDNESDNYGAKVNSDGTFGIKEATITIYEGSINENIKEGTGSRIEGLTTEQAIGSTAGHEIVHATDKVEINKDLKYQQTHNGQPRPKAQREDKTYKVENQIIKESKQKL